MCISSGLERQRDIDFQVKLKLSTGSSLHIFEGCHRSKKLDLLTCSSV